MKEHVLVIFPHPDDEAFSCSGTIASYTSKGHPVTYICMTLGQMGRNMGNPMFANRETLPVIRKKEIEKACDSLGITDLRLWGMHDKMVEFEDDDELAGRIKAVIEEVDPSLIITFYPGYSVHPDHDACGAAVVRAVRMIQEDRRPPVHCVAVAKNSVEMLGEPDIVVDISAFAAQKIAAISAHQSQFHAQIKMAEKDKQMKERMMRERFWIYNF